VYIQGHIDIVPGLYSTFIERLGVCSSYIFHLTYKYCMRALFRNALIHVVYSVVSGQCSYTITLPAKKLKRLKLKQST